MTNKKEKWSAAAWALPASPEKPPLPIHVLNGEALDLVRFAQRYWQPARADHGDETLPGLVTAAGNGTFSEDTVAEMLELSDALQAAQTNYRLLIAKRDPAPVDRALFVLSELRATLEWAFDDGQLTDEDGQLEILAEVHESARSHDAIAASLFDYAELAERHQDRLVGLGGFAVETIAESRALAQRLREQSAGPAELTPRPAEREALELRNRLATLLYERMLRTRAAARFAFRSHPDLLRQVGSAYARRKRSAARKRQGDNQTATPETEVAEV